MTDPLKTIVLSQRHILVQILLLAKLRNELFNCVLLHILLLMARLVLRVAVARVVVLKLIEIVVVVSAEKVPEVVETVLSDS